MPRAPNDMNCNNFSFPVVTDGKLNAPIAAIVAMASRNGLTVGDTVHFLPIDLTQPRISRLQALAKRLATSAEEYLRHLRIHALA